MDVAYHLHIDPRAQDKLTVQEWDEAVQAIQVIREETAKASK